MTFEEFQDYILHHILEDWMEEAEVQIKDIRRNNGVIYRGLSIREPGKKTAPSLCLNDLYLSSKGGENMEEVFAYIREDYRWAMEQAEEYMLDILDFSQVRDKIIYRLVNYEKNREIEETCPTLRLFDLLLTFRWVCLRRWSVIGRWSYGIFPYMSSCWRPGKIQEGFFRHAYCIWTRCWSSLARRFRQKKRIWRCIF